MAIGTENIDANKAERRENVVLAMLFAGSRKVEGKALASAKAKIPVSVFTATDTLKKCPTTERNKEKIFRKGDKVCILGPFGKNMNTPNSSQPYSSEKVFLCVNNKKMWMRPLNEVMDKVDSENAGTEILVINITQEGHVGKVAKRAAEKVEQVNCYYVDFKSLGIDHNLWIDANLFAKKEEADGTEIYKLDVDKFEISPFSVQKTYSGPEATFTLCG